MASEALVVRMEYVSRVSPAKQNWKRNLELKNPCNQMVVFVTRAKRVCQKFSGIEVFANAEVLRSGAEKRHLSLKSRR